MPPVRRPDLLMDTPLRDLTPRQRRGVAAYALRRGGLDNGDVGALLGISRKDASEYANDPLGLKHKARREGYAAGYRCIDCGGPVKADSRVRVSMRCVKCAWNQGTSARDRLRTRASEVCGVPGCAEPKAPERHVCAGHAPRYARLRRAFSIDEHAYYLNQGDRPIVGARPGVARADRQRRRRERRREAEALYGEAV